MKVGNIVKWSPTNSHARVGLVMRYCSLQSLWCVWFPKDGYYEIEEWCLEVVSEYR